MDCNFTDLVGFGEILDGIGRSDSGNYHDGAYGTSSNTKQAEREKVLDFMLSTISNDRVKLLSMPGESWAFEQMLLSARPQSQIVAVERSSTVYSKSRAAMPSIYGSIERESHRLQHRMYAMGSAEFEYSRVSMHLGSNGRRCGKKGTRSNRLVLMSIDAYMSMLVTDYRATMKEKADFHCRFYARNAVWLDFTSQLCAPVNDAIKNLHYCLYPDGRSKPVVITVRNGRDSFCGAQERVRKIEELQPLFKTSCYWTYTGKGSSSMLTVCGTIE